jgi:hypothetical protein
MGCFGWFAYKKCQKQGKTLPGRSALPYGSYSHMNPDFLQEYSKYRIELSKRFSFLYFNEGSSG